MGTLNIKEMKQEQAQHLTKNDYDITLKLDGTLIYFKDGKLFSPRCDRGDRFKHIFKILTDNNFPNCIGEMFIDEKGSCVFDVSRSENWTKAVFMPFDLIDDRLTYEQRQQKLSIEVNYLNNPFIKPLTKFNTFKEGWDYVVKNKSEGLVLRNSNKWFKVKILKEVKIEIKEHQIGKNKGCFILINDNKVSGTSEELVKQYLEIKKRGNKAIGEVEFAFLTDDGKYFQPRLRLIREEKKTETEIILQTTQHNTIKLKEKDNN